MKTIIAIGLLFFMIATSCQKEIEVKLSDFELKPVVNCLFSNDQPFQVFVSLPKKPYEKSYYLVKNAEVTINDEKGNVKTIPWVKDGMYSLPDFKPTIGILYSIEVKIPGFENASASDSIPGKQPELISYTTLSDVGIDDEGNTFSQLAIEFHDPDIKNYYDVKYKYLNKHPIQTTQGSNLYLYGIFSNDISVINEGMETFLNSTIFRDELFNGHKYKINFYYFTAPSHTIFFNYSVTAYNFIRSSFIHDYTKVYDFWETYEPLPLYSNIKNGYGIFAGFSSRTFEVYPDTTIIFQP